jgi:hypothetical protein
MMTPTLLPCDRIDLNRDAQINEKDIVLIAAASDANFFDERLDLNNDGVVDVIDRAVFRALLEECNSRLVTPTQTQPPP